MNNYIMHFAVYTLAMIGFIVIALFVYKKSVCASQTVANRNNLKVENSLRLSATKTVYVIKAGEEKFLIAADSANTTMLAKLENYPDEMQNSKNNGIQELPSLKSISNIINRG